MNVFFFYDKKCELFILFRKSDNSLNKIRNDETNNNKKKDNKKILIT